MNQYFKIKGEDTLNVIKNYIEDEYEYNDAKITTIGHKGYSDYREHEPDRVEFAVTAKKDLGLGIGVSEITLTLSEAEASAIMMKKLAEQDVQIAGLEFEKHIGSGYQDEGMLTFGGTKVMIKTLEDMKNLGKNPKVKTR